MTPEDEADRVLADMKESGPQRIPSIHLADDTWARDIGQGSLILHKTNQATGLVLERETIQELRALVQAGGYGSLLIQDSSPGALRTVSLSAQAVSNLLDYANKQDREAL